MDVIKIIEEAIETHKGWIMFFKDNPGTEGNKEYQYAGNIKHHEEWIEKYNKVIVEIERLKEQEVSLSVLL